MEIENIENKSLKELFNLADTIGSKRYNRLTQKDIEDYRKFDFWRYVNGKSECGTTSKSKQWVKHHSDRYCPVCGRRFAVLGGRTIDHKLPRSQYPWLSLDFKNLWVICLRCNQEKGEMHWYEYEHYIFINYPECYKVIKRFRPRKLLRSLKST